MEWLVDRPFLRAVNEHRVSEYFARIAILDFSTERPVETIEGKVTAGSININTSNVRRSGSLTVVFNKETFRLNDPDNLVAINKKVRIFIGINNPFYDNPAFPQWRDYPQILYFLQGIFLITAASSASSPTAMSININFIDKMGMLNGVCGGTIPASISLHDRLTIDGAGNITVDYPRIRQIIFEVVQQFGGENPARIVINDIPDFGRRIVRYSGATPIWFSNTPIGAAGPGGFRISATEPPGFPRKFTNGDDLGYMMAELIFPGELTKSAGATVAGILETIANTLGNYEYFYDTDGTFIFQQIRHFEMTGDAPLQPTGLAFNIGSDFDAVFQDGYLPKFHEDQFINEFMNNHLVNSVNYNPQYGEIKNDFIVWGTRQRDGEDSKVWMHLAIDEKPRDHSGALCRQWIWEVRAEDNSIIRYVARPNGQNPPPGEGWTFAQPMDLIGHNAATRETIRLHSPAITASGATVGSVLAKNSHAGIRLGVSTQALPFEWREELYRMALMAHADASIGTHYDIELRAEWRRIYNPDNIEFASRWHERFHPVPWDGYRREIITDPSAIHYWLDLIDTNSALGAYSVNRIGRRTIAKEDSQIHEVLNRQIPNVIFIDGRLPDDERERARQELAQIGQAFVQVQASYMPLFRFRNSFGSCFEVIRQLLHRHLIYNASVTVNSAPIFYLDVNRVVRFNFPDQGAVGNFIINRLSWNLGNNPRMSVTANEAVTIV